MAETKVTYIWRRTNIFTNSTSLLSTRVGKSPLHSHNLMIKGTSWIYLLESDPILHGGLPRLPMLSVQHTNSPVNPEEMPWGCSEVSNATGNLTGLVSLFKTHLLAQSRLMALPLHTTALLHTSYSTLLYHHHLIWPG